MPREALLPSEGGIDMATGNNVKRENYVILQGWMITDLGLKGNELIIYACIYGFSQAEGQTFSGGLQYLADWTNTTKQCVIKCLKSLVDKGYIVKVDNTIKGVKFCEYHVTKFTSGQKSLIGYSKNLNGGIQKSLPNNIVNNKDNKESNSEVVDDTKESYNSIIEEYTEDKNLRDTLLEYIKMRKRIRKPMTNYALTLALRKLDQLASSVADKIEILNQSIVNGWQDVYAIKGGDGNAGHGRGDARADDAYERGAGWNKIL